MVVRKVECPCAAPVSAKKVALTRIDLWARQDIYQVGKRNHTNAIPLCETIVTGIPNFVCKCCCNKKKEGCHAPSRARTEIKAASTYGGQLLRSKVQ